jgi:phage FluMu gp28-like protein
MKKYIKIQHPIRGTIPFNLYPFQEKTLQDFYENDFNIVLKSRQMGISTLVSTYSLWMMIFNKDKNILVISTKQEVAKEIISKVRFANKNLPSWFARFGVKCVEDNKQSLKYQNGSRIQATSSASDAGRSFALSLLIMDEAAFIDGVDEIWTAAYPALSTGGRAIILSTPNGVGNFFHKMWKDAEAKKNKFNTIKLPWYLHPERDQSWRDAQTEVAKSPKLAAQECDCLGGDSKIELLDTITGQEFIIQLHEIFDFLE